MSTTTPATWTERSVRIHELVSELHELREYLGNERGSFWNALNYLLQAREEFGDDDRRFDAAEFILQGHTWVDGNAEYQEMVEAIVAVAWTFDAASAEVDQDAGTSTQLAHPIYDVRNAAKRVNRASKAWVKRGKPHARRW